MRIPIKLLVTAVSSVALAGCAYGGLGYGSPYGYDSPYYGGYSSPYGYGGNGSGVSVSIGYGNGYGGGYGYGSPYGYGGYGSPYGYGGYGGYGYASPYGYGSSPYYGWYNNYYYPGTGVYVYDSYRQPHVMSDSQRRYWSQRQQNYVAPRTSTMRTTGTASTTRVAKPAIRENWSEFRKQAADARSDRRQQRADARQMRRDQR